MKKNFCIAAVLLTTFVLWTVAVSFVDVSPIGPKCSEVGFSALNGAFRDFVGVNMTLYTITDWLGLVPIAFVVGFGILGFCQLLKRRSFKKVDFSILVLGGFYIVVMAVFLLFEELAINYRPVLINGILEASYPSSTTMLATCVMPTAVMQLNSRIRNKTFRYIAAVILIAFTVFMVVGRVISGVHWISDIIGGALLSAGLVMTYYAVIKAK